MNISDLINRDTIVVDVEVSTKKQLIQKLSKIVGEKYNIDPTSVEDVISEREKLGSTGLGKGIALPHGRIAQTNKPIGLLAKVKDPIDFSAVDDEFVDIIFLLLAPDSAGADHLDALATVSKTLRDAPTREKIRAAKTMEEIADILGL